MAVSLHEDENIFIEFLSKVTSFFITFVRSNLVFSVLLERQLLTNRWGMGPFLRNAINAPVFKLYLKASHTGSLLRI